MEEEEEEDDEGEKTHLDARVRLCAWIGTNRLLLPVWIPQELIIISMTETMKMIKIHRP